MGTDMRPNILIVDDSPMTRAMIKRIIGMLDIPIGEVLEAGNGAEGLERLERSHIDLVLADLNMPVMDGFEMIERMRRNPLCHAVRVIVISAQPDPGEVEVLKRQGVAAYLAKPFTAEKLRDLIMPALQGAAHVTCERPPREESFNLALAESLASALETMAFITPEFVAGRTVTPLPSGVRVVRIDFMGRGTHGSLAVAASSDLLARIAASVDATGATSGDDALMELTNVTCGMLLRMRPEGGAGFHLSPPHLTDAADANMVDTFAAADAVSLQTDGELITAQVMTDSTFYGV
jgi:two-component system chemotaxis response regulator CheY